MEVKNNQEDVKNVLYNLDLFETVEFESNTYVSVVTRVPGGWIVGGVFVPYKKDKEAY